MNYIELEGFRYQWIYDKFANTWRVDLSEIEEQQPRDPNGQLRENMPDKVWQLLRQHGEQPLITV
ncbi:TPA: hypothetical protein EYN98_24420 [Candidatus Poribacteria bacterium]|nr:hypothetical protein [Candidatus Poribacteria bacterium]HIA69125.1 hypothetical protein [Candidatus Poribacteria bacterium]HIB90600.1 hypothetical protein [Candidatus Poribacteria bacterium]HIC01833.1 hypothetical protein [Candidatus Poribacteria bacterium]HIC02588.1 hypothetical protein [Candidatus Poribacteria bacterium]